MQLRFCSLQQSLTRAHCYLLVKQMQLHRSSLATRAPNTAHRLSCRRLGLVCRSSAGEQQQQPKKADPKRAAAEAVIDRFVSSNTAVAFGNGELVNQAIACLGERLMNKQLENVTLVAASSAAAHEAAFFGVPQQSLEEVGGKVSLLVEQVDQYDQASSSHAALKGIRAEPQQPELPRLREALAAADKVVLLAEGADVVSRLGGSLPVFIEATEGPEWEETAEALDDIFLGDAEIWRRPTSGTANPRGGKDPYISPDGHNICDIRFYEGLKLFGEDAPYEQIIAEIEQIGGVVTHGLLMNVADAVVVADQKQGVRVVECEKKQQAAAAASGSSS